MNAAITSVYSVIAVCTPWIVVSRSSTICEIATFMTLESSTMTNCAEAKMIIGSHLRIGRPPYPAVRSLSADRAPRCNGTPMRRLYACKPSRRIAQTGRTRASGFAL